MKKFAILLLTISLSSYGQCWQKVVGGYSHNLAKKVDGSLWAWGLNSTGQIGNGTTNNALIPKLIGSGSNWMNIAAGQQTSCATKTDGTYWTWGGYVTYTTPVQLGTDTDWVVPSAGEGFRAGLKTNGTLWLWGDNTHGVLGNGTTTTNNSPTQLGTDTYTSMDCGTWHMLAIKSDGTLWAWGDNTYGSLGNGTNTNSLVPIQVGTDTDWARVSAGNAISLAQKTNGTLWAWGRNDYGQAATGSFGAARTPQQIGTLTNWVKFEAGGFHCIATQPDGSVWSWGWNAFNEIGDMSATNRNVPTRTGGTTFLAAEVAAGSNHSIAIKPDGTAWGWGWNTSGQVGDNSTSQRSSPVAISCPTSVLAVNSFEITENLKIYPNPVKDFLNISYENPINIISIVNLLGQEVINTNQSKIDVSDLISGTYFIKISSDDFVKTIKVIKQ
jgi:alpha-tubulin suppressor-like RCC1 family protein